MHPFLNEHMAQRHIEELQHEAEVTYAADQAYSHLQEGTDVQWTYLNWWYLVFGLPILTPYLSEAYLKQKIPADWLQRRIQATIRRVSAGAFGVGAVFGSFLGVKFGLLPVAILGSIICLGISVPVLARSFQALKEHLLH